MKAKAVDDVVVDGLVAMINEGEPKWETGG